jgi:GNAT superfamily N-acetyltransferase
VWPRFADATPADARGLAAHVASWQRAYRGLLPEAVLAGLSVADRERAWREILRAPRPRTSTLLAVVETNVLGFASLGPARDLEDGDGRAGELYAIYLAPPVWSRGVGTQLHDAAVARLVVHGFDRAILWLLDGNERASRFYRRHGWTRDGGQKTVPSPPGWSSPNAG